MSNKALSQFQQLYKQKYGIDLTPEQALPKMRNLLYLTAFSKGKKHLLDKIEALQLEDLP